MPDGDDLVEIPAWLRRVRDGEPPKPGYRPRSLSERLRDAAVERDQPVDVDERVIDLTELERLRQQG